MPYKIAKQDACHFLTLQVVQWVDIFSRQRCRDIVIESLNYCTDKKGLDLFAYVIMTNHVHLLCRAKSEDLSDVIRDLKKHTSVEIIQSIKKEPESRRDWMLEIFRNEAAKHKRNETFQLWTHENHPEEIYSTGILPRPAPSSRGGAKCDGQWVASR